jgi:hypothetical protein
MQLKTKKYYSHNKKGFFIGTGEAQNSPKHEEVGEEWYMLPANATFIAVPEFNAELEIPKFDVGTQTWSVVDVEIQGIFYLKTDAAELAEIAKKDADLYTQIEPLQKYDDGTTQAFDDAAQIWEYTFKGADLLEAERVEALNVSKQDKIAQLESDFNAAKKITIQNGKTLIVEHDTPERDYFLKLIEDVSNLSTTQGAAFIYEQQTDAGKLALRIFPEIAAYIFKDLFVATLTNAQQTKVSSRVHNKTTVYELALKQINEATTQAELDAITKWTFLNPTGIVIDVNDKATEMLADASVSDFAKAAINAAKDPTTGEIHLVKTLEELAADS